MTTTRPSTNTRKAIKNSCLKTLLIFLHIKVNNFILLATGQEVYQNNKALNKREIPGYETL